MKAFSLALLFVSFSCLAQQDTLKGKYKWGIGLQVNSLEELPPIVNLTNFFQLSGDKKNTSFSLSIIGSHLLKNHSEIKIKVGITSYNYSMDYKTIQSGQLVNVFHGELKQKTWHYSVGVVKSFLIDKLTFYGGSDIEIKLFGKYLEDDKIEGYQNDTIIDIGFSNNIIDGGIGFGLGFNAGVNYRICNRLRLGLEFSSSFLYSKIGGNLIEHLTAYHSNNVLYYDETFIWPEKIEEFNLKKPQSSFYLKYSF
ncbi:MAG: hypothetical protein JJE25_14725 [Bacteroidia bacterium]|nr:hypothetical protein [Bacteroidia bacterium]